MKDALAGYCSLTARRCGEQDRDLGDLLKRAEHVAGVAADAALHDSGSRSHRASGDGDGDRRHAAAPAPSRRLRRRSAARRQPAPGGADLHRRQDHRGAPAATPTSLPAAKRATPHAPRPMRARRKPLRRSVPAPPHATRRSAPRPIPRICSVPAVAHDREPPIAIVAAEDPVGAIGQPVLVQRAGEQASPASTASNAPGQSPNLISWAAKKTDAATAPMPAPTSGKAQAASASAHSVCTGCADRDTGEETDGGGEAGGIPGRVGAVVPRRSSLRGYLKALATPTGLFPLGVGAALRDDRGQTEDAPWTSRPLRLDEIRALLAHLPGPDLEAGSAASARARPS